MRVLLIGATGPLGLEITRHALDGGHSVTAMVRDPARLALRHPDLKTVAGDVLQMGAIDAPMCAQEAVICCLGVKAGRGPVTLFSQGTEIILRAMQRHNVRRLICVTGIGAGDSKGHGGLFYDRLLQPLLLRRIYEDKTRQEELVRRSDRDWIIVRPARLTNGRQRRHYGVVVRVAGLTAGSISRADAAEFVTSQLKMDKYLYKAPVLTY
jgi:putative NADH-flavin reductase